MEPGQLDALPIKTSRHILKLLQSRLISDTTPLVVPNEDPIWDDTLWDEEGHSIDDVFEDIANKIESFGHLYTSGRYFALMPNSGNFISCLAGLLLGQMEGRGDKVAESIEKTVMRWMCDVIGYPETADGYLLSGASASTIIAIATAREAKRCNSSNYNKLVVYIQPRTHISLGRALEVVGLGSCKQHQVKADNDHRMCPKDLEKWIHLHKQEGLIPFLIAGTIGTADLGSIDPIDALADIAEKHDLWLHVDGAIGGFYALCEKLKTVFNGIQRADSIVINPHKSLAEPSGCGALIFKNGHLKDLCCRSSGDVTEPLLFWENPLENKMMFRSFSMWFALQVFGVSTFRDVLNRNLMLARYMYDQLRTIPELVVLCPQLSIVVFRCQGEQREANQQTELLIEKINRKGRVYLSPTMMSGFSYVRVAISNFRTHFTTIKLCLEEIRAAVGSPVEGKGYETDAEVWLDEFDKRSRPMEAKFRIQHMDRVLRIVHCRILYGEQEDLPGFHGISPQTLAIQEEPTLHIDELLGVANAINFPAPSKAHCRLVGTIGHFVASCSNYQSGMWKLCPGAAELEGKIISKLATSLGMSSNCRGVLASDTWSANTLCFIASRNAKLETFDFGRAVVYTDERSKTYFSRTLRLIGLGECSVRTVQTTSSGDLDIDDLTAQITRDTKNPDLLPWLVAQRVQGTWSPELVRCVAEICETHGMWHHVEVQPEGLQAILRNFKSGVDLGMSKTQSVSIDMGEALCLPIGVAAAIVRDHHHLYKAMNNYRPPIYLMRKDPETHATDNNGQGSFVNGTEHDDTVESGCSPSACTYEAMAYSFEFSRPFRALPVWFTLRLLGTKACC